MAIVSTGIYSRSISNKATDVVAFGEKRKGETMRTNLRVRRRQKHIRTKDIAEQLGITPSSYTRLENGYREPSIATWKKIKEILEVPDAEMWSLMQEDE